MTTMTKADIQYRLDIAEDRVRVLEREMAEFKKKVSERTAYHLEENEIEVCESGLAAWARDLGVEIPQRKKEYVIQLKMHVEGTEEEIDRLTDKMADLVTQEFEVNYHDQEYWED